MRAVITAAASLGAGAAAAQVLAALSIPVLARLYPASHFGIFSVFFLSSQMLGVVLAARYEQAIVLAATPREAETMAAACLSQAAILSSALFCLLLLASAFVWPEGGLSLAWPLVAICALFLSAGNTLSTLCLRHGWLAPISYSRFSKIAIALAAQLLFAVCFGASVWGLMVGETIGAALALLPLLPAGLRPVRMAAHAWASGRLMSAQMLALLYTYRELPRINLPHVLSNSLGAFIVAAVANASFSPAAAGSYFMMQRVVGLPATVAGTAVAQAYYASAAKLYRASGTFDGLLIRIALLQASIGLAVAATLILYGEELFTFVLGPQWTGAGRLAAIYAPYVAVHLVLSTLAPTPQIAGKLKRSFALAIVQFALFTAAFYAGSIIYQDIDGAVRLAAWASIPYMLLIIGWYYRISQAPSQSPQEFNCQIGR